MEAVNNNIKGHVLVVMAPTGSGKGTLIKRLLAEYTDIKMSVSCTSRAMRPNDVEGKDYYFLSRTEFEDKIAQGDFLEWAEFAGNLYGTLKSEIIPHLSENNLVLLEIELQGVENLLQLLPRKHITIAYIESGGWDVLKARAIARADISEEDLKKRYERYLIEQEVKPSADVIIDNREGLEEAYADLRKTVIKALSKCK